MTQTLDTTGLAFYNLAVNSGAVLQDINPDGLSVDNTLTNNGTLQRTRDVEGSTDVTFFDTGGYGGLVFNANSSDLGSTTVTIQGDQDCTTTAGESVQRCFDIAPENTTGRDALMTFYFADNELSGNACSTLEAYHWNGSAWDQQTRETFYGTDGRSCSAEPYSLRVQNVSDISPFILESSGPTAVTLASFTATADDDAVLLEWETASEVDLLGFHLYRAETPHGPQTRLNADLIPGQAPGSPVGVAYQFRDEAVEPGVTYWYWLEGVDVHGWAMRHGPVSSQGSPGSRYRIDLPLVHEQTSCQQGSPHPDLDAV